MKISILLPYKENFSSEYAGAVSIFVKETTIVSKYKKNITVYGNTKYKKKLLPNYKNINFTNKIFQSSSKIYVDNFIKDQKKNKPDIIEIHNRPAYVNQINKIIESNIVLYFHNDPLMMNGSKKKVKD